MQTKPTDEPTKVNDDETGEKRREELLVVHQRMLKRFGSVNGSKGFEDIKAAANEDAEFVTVEGAMWDKDGIEAWGDRPTLEVNQLQSVLNVVIGDQRESDVGVKVLPAGAGATKKGADVFNGLIRNIMNISNFEDPRDNSFRECATAGFGGWYISTEWNLADPWVQDIKIKPIRSAVNMLWIDPASTDECNEDANWMIVGEEMSEDDFDDKYPDAGKADFPLGADDYRSACIGSWRSEGKVRVGDYWEKVAKVKTVGKFSRPDNDPKTGEATVTEKIWEIDKQTEKILDEAAGKGWTLLKQKDMDSFEIVMYKVSGMQVLAGPFPWAGLHIPVVPEYGYQYWLDGVRHFWGLVRFAKDSARLYNYTISSIVYQMAKFKSKTAVTKAMVADTITDWEDPDQDIVEWQVDPKAPNAIPFNLQGAPFPATMVTVMQESSQNQQKVTGRHASSQGDNPLDQSGIAIGRLQRQGDLGTFALIDNLAKSIRRTGEILIDLIPRIYDTDRQLRIVEADGSTRTVRNVLPGSQAFAFVNTEIKDKETGESVLLVDLNQGRYDATESVSASYATRRQEFLDSLIRIAQTAPELGLILADLLVEASDFVGSEKALKRIQEFMNERGLRKPTPEEVEEAKEEVQNAPKREPSPQEQAALDTIQLGVDKLKLENDSLQVGINKTAIENLKAQQELEQDENNEIKEAADTGKVIAETERTEAETELKEAQIDEVVSKTLKNRHEVGADRLRLRKELEQPAEPAANLQ